MARNRDVSFFFKHAGYATPPGLKKTAQLLARAEEWARDNDYSFRWQEDRDATQDADYTQWQCDIFDADGDPVTGLGGIDFGEGGDPYKRVVEAELALEAMPK